MPVNVLHYYLTLIHNYFIVLVLIYVIDKVTVENYANLEPITVPT